MKNTNGNLSHFLPYRTPTPLIVFLIFIEVVSFLARPIALRVRLTANITARHLLIHLGAFSLYIWPLFVMLFLLELRVAFIQAYVFYILSSLYYEEMVL